MKHITVVSLEDAGEVMKDIRKYVRGLTQPDLRKILARMKIKYSLERIVNLEKGHVPFSVETLRAYEKALGIKVNLIIALDDQDMKRLIDLEEAKEQAKALAKKK